MRAGQGWWHGAGRPLLLALSLFLAGCGGGGGGGGGTTPPPSTPPFGPGGGSGGGGSTPVQGWNPSERISNLRDNFTEMSTPSVALTSQSVGFAAWTERAFGTACAKTWVNRNAAGTWGTPTQIGIEQASSPMVAANANGDAVLVWIENAFSTENCGGTILTPGLYASRYSPASNTWTAPVRIVGNASAPSVVIDAAGHASAVWVQSPATPAGLPTISWSRFDGTSWSAPLALSDGTRGVAEPVIARDGSGSILALWQQQTNLFSSGQPILPNIWFARYDAASGIWSPPALIGSPDLSGTNDTAGHARIAVNASGNAVAVWRETRGSVGSIVSARYSAATGNWTSPLLIESNTQPADRPEVAIDVNGNGQAVWMQKIDGSQANDSGYTARFDATGGSWSAPQLFEQSTEGVFAPLVGMEDLGRALIAWEQTNAGTGPIHAVHFTPASGFGTVMHFSGNSVGLAVNSGGTALLASDVSSVEPAPIFLGISIRAAMFLP